MGYWLIAAIALQLACAFCAAKLARPTVWLQIILLLPVFGALAFCGSEVLRMLSHSAGRPNPRRQRQDRQGGVLGGIGYRAVSARTPESRMALAEECMLLGRHADARLLYESYRRTGEAENLDFQARLDRAESGRPDERSASRPRSPDDGFGIARPINLGLTGAV